VMRDNGQLKRLRGTPLPPWAFLTGQIDSQLVPVTIEAVLVLGLGRLLFQVSLPRSASAWGAFSLVMLLGAAAFSALGVAYTGLVANADAAPADAGGLPAAAVPVGRLVPAGQPAALTGLARRGVPAGAHAGRHALGADLRPGARGNLAGRLQADGLAGRCLLAALGTFRWERAA